MSHYLFNALFNSAKCNIGVGKIAAVFFYLKRDAADPLSLPPFGQQALQLHQRMHRCAGWCFLIAPVRSPFKFRYSTGILPRNRDDGITLGVAFNFLRPLWIPLRKLEWKTRYRESVQFAAFSQCRGHFWRIACSIAERKMLLLQSLERNRKSLTDDLCTAESSWEEKDERERRGNDKREINEQVWTRSHSDSPLQFQSRHITEERNRKSLAMWSPNGPAKYFRWSIPIHNPGICKLVR